MTSIFQVELDFLAREPQFERFGFAAMVLLNTTRLAQDLPNGGLRARQAHPSSFELRITVDEIQERFWSWNAL